MDLSPNEARELVLADHAALRARHPGARVAGLDLGERQFVMLLTGTAEE